MLALQADLSCATDANPHFPILRIESAERPRISRPAHRDEPHHLALGLEAEPVKANINNSFRTLYEHTGLVKSESVDRLFFAHLLPSENDF